MGPRGTGKSTWLRDSYPKSLFIDLLESERFLELHTSPQKLRELVRHLEPKTWVVIDEIQKVPNLLSEVHQIYETQKLNFALSGSSARKLRAGGADLLAGRALQTFLFPLVHSEYSEHLTLDEAINWGTLPSIVMEKEFRERTLTTYVQTYLKEEILSESLVRKLDPFTRFLRVAGQRNGQLLNTENIARESSVKRTTADHYFGILEDTLLGYQLPALRRGYKKKEVAHSKFYFFDAGVARAAAGLVREQVDGLWLGFALETLILNEIKAYNSYSEKERPLYHYSVTGGYDIDFVIETKLKTYSQPGELLCIEAKLSKTWNPKWCDPMLDFKGLTKSKVKGLYGLYLGKDRRTIRGVEILPIPVFLKMLYKGEIF